MSEAKAETKGAGRMPPYISLSTLLTFIEELKVNGIPPQIDNSVLKRFSGSVRAQLLSALKWLGLLTEDKKPAGLLPVLVEHYGDDAEFKKTLATVVNSQYAFLGQIDLTTATPTMFADAFRNTFGGQDAVLAKCRTFYMQAAKYVGIELGQRLTAGTSSGRASGATRSAPRKRGPKRAPAGAQNTEPPAPPNGSSKQPAAMLEKLMDKFPKFDPKWDAATQAKWFEGFKNFQNLMANPKGGHEEG